MAEYVIMTNSTCDLTEEMIQALGLTVLTLGLNIGEETFKEIPVKAFYQKIREGAMPTTNAANIGEYVDAFEAMLQDGKDVLCLVFSSALSTTYNSALMAAEEMREKYPDRKLFVVDTVSASMGEGLLAWYASGLKQEGKTIEEVRDWVEVNKLNLAHWFTVNDLDHLKRGGRISAAKALMGSMLGIKPILRINDEGKLVPADKVRGRQQSLLRLLDQMEKTGVNLADQTIFISHSDCYDDAKWLADQIQEKYGVKEVVINYIGPVIGSHTGIGTVALFFMATGRE